MDLLLNKAYKKYDKISRYSNFPYYYHKIDNKYIYGTTANLDDNTPYELHVVRRNDTLDSIALEYYNNPTYYWVIADYNRIADPFDDLVEGSTLKVPSFSNIKFLDK